MNFDIKKGKKEEIPQNKVITICQRYDPNASIAVEAEMRNRAFGEAEGGYGGWYSHQKGASRKPSEFYKP